MVTLEDIARITNVSVSTVSRALSGKGNVNQKTLKRIRKAALQLGYQPNEIARGLKTKSSKLIGLVIHNIFNPTYQKVANVIQEKMSRSEYQIILCITNDSVQQESAYIDTLLKYRVDGLIVVPTGVNQEAFGRVRAAAVPVVAIIRRHQEEVFDTVLQADTQGAYQATTHLIRQGHRRIGLIVGSESTTSGSERLAGYRQALNEAGIDILPELIHQGPYALETGIQASAALLALDEPVTAIFCANHEASGGLLRVVSERRIAVPADLSILCYEDSPWFISRYPMITVMDNDPVTIAEYAVDLLLRKLDRSGDEDETPRIRELRVGPRLIERDSCAPPGIR